MMRKATLLNVGLCFGLLAAISCKPTTDKYLETEAIEALDKTTEVIGNLNACSLRVLSQQTEVVDGTPETHIRQSDVYLRGNNNMHVYSSIDDARKAFWYNGKELAVYRFDEKQFDIAQAPPTTIEMIDEMNRKYGIDFPAADIFYPTLADDVIENFDSVFYLPVREIDGQRWYGVHAVNDSLDVSLFVDEATHLPTQLIIVGIGPKTGEMFNCVYQDWQLNPTLGDEIFKFTPPAEAQRIEIISKK